MTIDSIRKVQLVLNQALISHSLPDSRLTQNQSTNNSGNDKIFTASKYLHASNYVARQFYWLPEASFILNYTDPYPQIEYLSVSKSYQNNYNSDTSIKNRSGKNYSSYESGATIQIQPLPLKSHSNHNSNTITNNISIASLFSKLSFATLLIYIGTCPILIQRILITLPSPLLCSLFGIMIAFIANAHMLTWIFTTI